MKRPLTQKELARRLWLAAGISLVLLLHLMPGLHSLEDSLTLAESKQSIAQTTKRLEETLVTTTVLLSDNEQGLLVSSHRFSFPSGWSPNFSIFLDYGSENPPVWAGYTNGSVWEGCLVFGVTTLEEAVSFRATDGLTDQGGGVHSCDDILTGPIHRDQNGFACFLAWVPFGEGNSVLWFQTLELLNQAGQVMYRCPLPQL